MWFPELFWAAFSYDHFFQIQAFAKSMHFETRLQKCMQT